VFVTSPLHSPTFLLRPEGLRCGHHDLPRSARAVKRLNGELEPARAGRAFEKVGDGVCWPLLRRPNLFQRTCSADQPKRPFRYGPKNLMH